MPGCFVVYGRVALSLFFHVISIPPFSPITGLSVARVELFAWVCFSSSSFAVLPVNSCHPSLTIFLFRLRLLFLVGAWGSCVVVSKPRLGSVPSAGVASDPVEELLPNFARSVNSEIMGPWDDIAAVVGWGASESNSLFLFSFSAVPPVL